MEMNTVITISREYGSGGRDIGKLVAEKLNIPYYDQEITEIAAKKSGLSNEVLRENDEIATTSIFGNFMAGSYFFANQAYNANELTINDQLYLLESQIIQSLAGKGPCVIIGRCADYVLREHKHVLNVFVHADIEFRKKRAVEHYGISPKKIEEFLRKQDKHRAHYHSFYTDQKWKAIENYDLTIDSSRFGIDASVEMIIAAAKIKSGI